MLYKSNKDNVCAFVIVLNATKTHDTIIIVNDTDSILSFYFCQEGRLEWQGPVCQQLFNHPISTCFPGGQKLLSNNQCCLCFFFTRLFNTNSVQIKIELIAQAHREKGQADGVIGKVLKIQQIKYTSHKFEKN